MLISDILGMEPSLMLGNAPMSLFPMSCQRRKEGRKEGQDVCFSESSDAFAVFGSEHASYDREWNVSAVSHGAMGPAYITSGSRTGAVECSCCSGAVVCWLRIANGGSWRVTFLPISYPGVLLL